MQCLRDKHGKTIIKGGKLAGASYESVEEEKLRKVAKRYTGDPEFVKYARGCVVLLDLQAGEEPLACVPLYNHRVRESQKVFHRLVSWPSRREPSNGCKLFGETEY